MCASFSSCLYTDASLPCFSAALLPYPALQVDPTDPAAAQAVDMFTQMDADRDGRVTRREMLGAIRRNRQVRGFSWIASQFSAAQHNRQKCAQGCSALVVLTL